MCFSARSLSSGMITSIRTIFPVTGKDASKDAVMQNCFH
jgi:hypothetical protein